MTYFRWRFGHSIQMLSWKLHFVIKMFTTTSNWYEALAFRLGLKNRFQARFRDNDRFDVLCHDDYLIFSAKLGLKYRKGKNPIICDITEIRSSEIPYAKLIGFATQHG